MSLADALALSRTELASRLSAHYGRLGPVVALPLRLSTTLRTRAKTGAGLAKRARQAVHNAVLCGRAELAKAAVKAEEAEEWERGSRSSRSMHSPSGPGGSRRLFSTNGSSLRLTDSGVGVRTPAGTPTA